MLAEQALNTSFNLSQEAAISLAVDHLLWQESINDSYLALCAMQTSCERCPMQHSCQL